LGTIDAIARSDVTGGQKPGLLREAGLLFAGNVVNGPWTGQFLTFPTNFLTAFADCISILEAWSISRVAPRLLLVTV
jgi:hypothetical protein